jgi:hypothetical protein
MNQTENLGARCFGVRMYEQPPPWARTSGAKKGSAVSPVGCQTESWDVELEVPPDLSPDTGPVEEAVVEPPVAMPGWIKSPLRVGASRQARRPPPRTPRKKKPPVAAPRKMKIVNQTPIGVPRQVDAEIERLEKAHELAKEQLQVTASRLKDYYDRKKAYNDGVVPAAQE